MKPNEFLAYEDNDFVSNNYMQAVAGVKSCNSMVDFRAWWEVPQKDLGGNLNWKLLHNGSPYCPFHYPAFFAVRADKGKWTQLMAKGGARPGEKFYEEVGLAYGKRTDSMYGYIKPKEQVFSQEGQSIFTLPGVSIWAALGLVNSRLYTRHANYVAGQHKYHNYLNKICLPTDRISIIDDKAKEAHETLRKIDQANENTSLFVCPNSRLEFDPECTIKNREFIVESLISNVNDIRNRIDDDIYECLNVTDRDDENKAVDYYLHYFGESYSEFLFATTWISYALGSIFGRWDIRFSLKEKKWPELPDPFNALRTCSIGQLQNERGLPLTEIEVMELQKNNKWNYPIKISWNGILVDDPSHHLDIGTQVSNIFQKIWKDKWDSLGCEMIDILNIQSLRNFLKKPSGFFSVHLKREFNSEVQF